MKGRDVPARFHSDRGNLFGVHHTECFLSVVVFVLLRQICKGFFLYMIFLLFSCVVVFIWLDWIGCGNQIYDEN